MLSYKATLAAIAASFVISSAASESDALTLPPLGGDYNGVYHTKNADTYHGLWLPNFITGADTKWGVTEGKARYNSNLELLTLDFKAQNKTATDLAVHVSVELKELTLGLPSAPYCGSANWDCGSNQITAAEKAQVKYFDYVSATLTGDSPDLAGLSVNLNIAPDDLSKPAQFGYCANWFDCAFGYSNWFTYDVVNWSNGNYVADPNNNGGRGDINLTLVPTPLPAAAWFLIAGLGTIGVVGRRRSKQA